MRDVEIADEVAALVGQQDLDELLAAAERSYDCVRCGAAARLTDAPAAVVVLRSGALEVARLAHAACCRSGVVELPPGALTVAHEAPAVAVAAVLPHASGARPVLLVEPSLGLSVRDSAERVDLVTTGLLRKGLHLVASAGRTPQRTPGWRVTLTPPDVVGVVDPTGVALYEGPAVPPDGWLQLVDAMGECVLLCATGLGLAEEMTVAEGLRRLNEAAKAGRLVGARVPVTLAR